MMSAYGLLTEDVATAFDSVAEIYDQTFSDTPVGQAQRKLVWQELDELFFSGQRVLDVNCGTGVDAVHLASRGIEVVACDASLQMISVARRRAESQKLSARIHFHVIRTEEISTVEKAGSFDGVVSNFGGLNCVEDLSVVARQFACVLNTGGRAVVCLFGRFCAWEIFWYLARGKVRKAFRRFSRRWVQARLDHKAMVRIRYPSACATARAFAPWFELEKHAGVGITVPPSYLEFLAARFPGALRIAERLDRRFGHSLLRSLGDHYLLTFRRA